MVNKLTIRPVLKIEILAVKILVSKDLDFIKNLNIFRLLKQSFVDEDNAVLNGHVHPEVTLRQ